MRNEFLAVCAATCLSAFAAYAATVDITLTQYDDRAAAVAAQNLLLSGHTLFAYEDFESFRSADADGVASTADYDFATPVVGLDTNVGTFTSILPDGTGGSNRAPDDAAIIRSNADENNNGAPNYGRYDADNGFAEGANFIDSNDNTGIRLSTASGDFGGFNRISFILTDLDDVGGVNFGIWAGGVDATASATNNFFQRGNGDIFLATLSFSSFVSDVTVDLTIDPGDGFGADSFAISAVPLPAPLLMLLTGLSALGAVRRRTRA